MSYKKQVHINQNRHRKNKKNHFDADEPQLPAITVRTYKRIEYTECVVLKGEIEFQYKPNNPLSCGAKMWIETKGQVKTGDFSELYDSDDEEYYNTTIGMSYQHNKLNPLWIRISPDDDFIEFPASYMKVNGYVKVTQVYDYSATWYLVETAYEAIEKILRTTEYGTTEKYNLLSKLWEPN